MTHSAPNCFPLYCLSSGALSLAAPSFGQSQVLWIFRCRRYVAVHLSGWWCGSGHWSPTRHISHKIQVIRIVKSRRHGHQVLWVLHAAPSTDAVVYTPLCGFTWQRIRPLWLDVLIHILWEDMEVKKHFMCCVLQKKKITVTVEATASMPTSHSELKTVEDTNYQNVGYLLLFTWLRVCFARQWVWRVTYRAIHFQISIHAPG